jgi:lysozyme
MAFDSLQVPATIINNDKLISMAGNLMAKQKAEKDAYSKSLIDKMATIDSAGIRNKDVSVFNKMYNDYVSYGSANVNNLDNPEVQVKLKQMENQVRGFINVSKGGKEMDVKVLALTSPDFDDNTRKESQAYLEKPTLERAESFDFTKSRKVDDKDYGAEALKMFSVDITSNIDGVELKNMDEGAIRERVSNLMNSKANLPTVQKGVLQIGGGNAEKGTDMLQEMIVQETLAKQSQKIDDPSEAEKTKSYFSKYGYNENLIPALKFAADLTYALAKGDPKATKLLKNSAGEAIELIDNGKTIEISAKDNYGNNKKIQVFDRGSSMGELGRQVAGFLNVYGTKMGFKTIPLPEYDAFIKDPNYSKYGKAAMPIKGSTAEKEYNADPNYFNAFKTNVPVVKTATPKAAPIPAPIPQTVPNPNTVKPVTSAQVKTPALPKTKEPKNIGVGDSLLNGINFTPIVEGKKKSNEPKVVVETPKIPTEENTPTTAPVNKEPISNNDDLYSRVKEHEGVRNSVYKDSRGNLTIGVGFNLNRSDANKRLKSVGADPKLIRSGKGKLTDNQIDTLYKEDLNKAKISAKKLVLKTWDELPKGVQGVLTEMAFNLGEGGLSEFKNTLGYIEEKRFKLASQSMLKSKWARQIGDRAKTLANIIGNA